MTDIILEQDSQQEFNDDKHDDQHQVWFFQLICMNITTNL